MADKKISELVNYTPPIDIDIFPVVDSTNSSTKKITWANVKAALKTYFDSLTTTLTNKTLTSPLFTGTIDGWISTGTFTYASATTITVAAGAASIYQKGDKIRFKQTAGTYKYYYITAVADTLLTVTGGSDYTVLDEAITVPAYSKIENPLGFPNTFNFTTTPTTSGDVYTNAPTINSAIFFIKNNTITVKIKWTFHGTSGGTGNCIFTIPLTPAYSYQAGCGIAITDSKSLKVFSYPTAIVHASLYDGTTCIANSKSCDLAITITY